MRFWIASLAGVLLAMPVEAEIFRCVGPEGTLRFTSERGQCPGAVPYEPAPERLQQGVVAPPGESPAAPAPAPSPAQAPTPPLGLPGAFPPPARVDPSWEVLDEPVMLADPEMRALGLRDSATRHYTRARGPVSEVCTVELWRFDRPAQALGVGARLGRPSWWQATAGPVLVLAHGIRLERQVGSREGLVPGCEALGRDTHARALALP